MSMTPAEMREMAALSVQKAAWPTWGDAQRIAAAIRAIPIPDTTAAAASAALVDAEIEKIMEMTDAEVDADLRADGKDPEKVAGEMRKTIDRVLAWHDALEKAREALRPFAANAQYGEEHYPEALDTDETPVAIGDVRRAREALVAIDAAKAKGQAK